MSARRMAAVVVAAGLMMVASVFPASATSGDPARGDLNRAMDRLVAAGAAGVQMRVHDRHGEWTGSAGREELWRPDPVRVDGRFRVGSITKMFVAIVVHQLVGEAKVALDDPVARYLPEFGLDNRITVRMILGHTSGLYDAIGEAGPTGVATGPSAVDWSPIGVVRHYRAADMVRFAVSRPVWFPPGRGWRYSNTNYLIAGLLIEKLTGTPYARQIERRIIEPLRLTGTLLPGDGLLIPGPHAHGYETVALLGAHRVVDASILNPSLAGSAGEIISTTSDLDAFLAALLHGRLLRPQLLAQLLSIRTVSRTAGYGLGIARESRKPGCVGFGHNGGIPGYDSAAFSSADGERRVEISVTIGSVDRADRVAHARYRAAFDALKIAGLCGSRP